MFVSRLALFPPWKVHTGRDGEWFACCHISPWPGAGMEGRANAQKMPSRYMNEELLTVFQEERGFATDIECLKMFLVPECSLRL